MSGGNGSRKYVGIQVKLEGKETIKKDLQDIFKYVENNKNIKINFDDASLNSLNNLKQALNEIQKDILKISNSSLVPQNINTSNADKQLNNLLETKEKISKTSIKFIGDNDNPVQKITTINQGLGKTLQIAEKLNKEGSLVSTKTYTVDYEKQAKEQDKQAKEQEKQLNNLYSKYEKIGKKIDELKDKGKLYNSVFAGNSKTKSLDSLYKNVDFSNLEKAKQQIQQITNEIDRLSGNVTKIDTLKSAIDSIKNSYNNLRSGSSKEVFGTLDKSSVNEYQKAYQELLNMRNKLKSGNGKDISFKNINDSIDITREKLKVLQNQFNSNLGIDKLITKAETAFNKLQLNSSQLNPDVLQKLQAQFNSFNTKTASNEITNFIQRCNQLGKTDSSVLKVQKAISSLNNSMRNLTISNGGNLKSSNELTEYSNKLKELKSLMNQMKNGTFINSGTLNNSILSANNSFNRLKTTVKETSTAIKQTKSSAVSLGSSISATLSKFGIYTSMALACRKLFEEFKQGVEYVKYLNESFTDMKMTMADLTENEFNIMGEQLDEMAKKMGVTIESVHDIGRIYSNEQTSTSEILEKTKPTAEFSNISGMDALTATKNMQDITNQFQLLENEGAKASEVFSHVGDVMTAVSKNMVYDFSSGLQQLSSAISTAGSVAQMSGVSMEKFTAEIGALIEQTGMSGSEAATGYKMISARVLQIKSVAEDLGVSEEDMSKAQKALDRLGITIEDSTTGSLKPLDTILEEVGAKWNGLTDVEKQYTSEMLAGNRQRNVFVALMNSMTQQQELYNKAMESSGSLEEANNIKAESIEGKLNTLKDTVKEFWSNLINSDQIKTLIDDGTKLIELISNIPTPIITTTAKLAFLTLGLNLGAKAIIGLVSGLSKLKLALVTTSLTSVGTQAVQATGQVNLLTKAIATLKTTISGLGVKGTALSLAKSPLAWLVAAIGTIYAVDKGLTSLDNKIRGDSSKSTDDVKTQQQDLSTSLSQNNQINELTNKYKKLSDEVKKTNISEEERVQKNEELKSVKEQLSQIEDEYKYILNNENLTIDEQIEKMKELAKIDVKEKAKKLDKDMMSQTDIDKKKQDLEKNLQLYELIQKAKKQDEDSIIQYDGNDYSAAAFLAYYSKNGKEDDLVNNINDANGEIIKYNSNVQLMQNENYKTSRSIVELTDNENKLIKQMNGEIETSDDLLKKKVQLKNSLIDSWGGNNTYDQEDSYGNAKDQFTKSIEEIEKIQKIINEIGNSKKFDDDTLKSMVEMFPELSTHLDDVSYCVDYMNQKIQGLGETQKNAYQKMIENSEEYFTANIKNTQEWQQITNGIYTDLANSDNSYYKELANDMQENFNNCKTLAEAKLEMETTIIKMLAEAWSEYYTSQKKVTEELGTPYILSGSEAAENHVNSGTYDTSRGDAEKQAQKNADELSKKYDKIAEITKAYKEKMDNFSANISMPDFVGTIGSNITDNKDSSKSKSEEKDYSVEDVEDLTDAYHDLNNAITLVEAKLRQLQARYENLYGKSKAQAMQEQVDILRQQLDLHSQMESKINSELAKQRSELASQGVTFDSSGMISNYNEILTSLRNQANAIQTVDENSKKAKEDSIKSLKDLKSKMDDYNSSITKDLEEQKTTWLELQNQIKETYKTMEKMVTDGESKVTDVIKSEIDKRKEKELDAIDKVKEALQDQWDIDDYDDQLQEAQDKVMEYEEKIANAIKLGDTNSLTELKKEQQDAIKELNDTVKQHERDTINDELDDQTDNINKKYEEMEKSENLTKMVTEALQTGFIKINDEVISLSSAMDDFIKGSTVGIGTINQTTRELNETLADTLAMLNQLGGYSGLNNLLPNVPYQMLANSTGTIDRNTVFTDSGNNTRSISIKLGDMYVNGNLDNVTLEDVNNTISKRFKEVVGNYIS